MKTGYFYHSLIRKYVAMFGSMFSDITVRRYDNAGTVVQDIPVPIAYGPKEHWLARINQDPSLNKGVAITLPRLAFEFHAPVYDTTRTINKGLRIHNNTSTYQTVPVPYNFPVSLYGMFATTQDSDQVLEQILPFFRPEWTQTLNLIPEINDSRDIATVLNNVDIEDTYENDFINRRMLIHTYNFTVRGYLYGPTTKEGKIIRKAIINLGQLPNENKNVTITLTPGLLANGSPTSNSAASVPINSINADDDYGYAFTITDN